MPALKFSQSIRKKKNKISFDFGTFTKNYIVTVISDIDRDYEAMEIYLCHMEALKNFHRIKIKDEVIFSQELRLDF